MKSLITMALAAILFPCAVSVPARASDATIAFRGVDVFDGSRMLRRTTVIVHDGMIRAVGPDVAIPPSARLVDANGKTLLPGLFDAHTHLGVRLAAAFLRDASTFGVTTELEMGGSEVSLDLRKRIASGESADGADLRTSGIVVTVPKGHPTEMDGPGIPTLAPGDDVQAFVDARIAEGADYIKVVYDHAFPTLTKQQLEDVVAAAHRRNKLVVAHSLTQRDARDAIAAGVDGLVHIFADSPPDADFAGLAARHHVFVVPTLTVIESATGESDRSWWQNAPYVASHITPSMRGPLDMKMPRGIGGKLKLTHAQAAVRALRRAGVPILAGTDAPSPGVAHGLSFHRELELLVLSGLTPSEALASATSEPARAFGFHDRGRIAAGLRADLLLINGDPTVDIRATRDIVGVWKLGVPPSAFAVEPAGMKLP
jgi:imidazolonepropionase-like amidohydrolase